MLAPDVKLAREVLTFLALLDDAEKTKDVDAIRRAKAARKKLELACGDIVSPPAKPGAGLFDEPDPFAGTKYAEGKANG